MMVDTENTQVKTFDDVMNEIGRNGYFQKRFNWTFNFGLVVCISMANINIIMALSIPDHWCFVPGRESTNFSQEEWKKITIPREKISKLNVTIYEKCVMFDQNYESLNEDDIFSNETECKYGWQYDKTWFEDTIPSSQNWVCDNSIKVSNVLAVMRVADVVGGFICGQLGDIIGRRPIFIITIICLVTGNLLFTITERNYILFLIASFIAGFTSYTAYQSPMILGIEISREKDQAHVAMLQNIGRTIGICLLPPLMWVLGHWKPFIILSTVPCLLFFTQYKYIIESPRWLATSNKKSSKTIKMLEKIAKINNTKLPVNTESVLQNNRLANTETVYGILSLFSNWRMSKNTLCMVICCIVSIVCYLIMTLNISNLHGNPLMNFFYQGAIEIPAIILGKYLCNKIGRKITNVGSFSVVVLVCLPIVYFISTEDDSFNWMIIFFATVLKFSIMVSYYVTSLQNVEIFPTCLRQTGVSFCALSASAFCTSAPYVIYMGEMYDQRYPYLIIIGLSILATICGVILPETQGKSPNTIQEAENFGNSQTYFPLKKFNK